MAEYRTYLTWNMKFVHHTQLIVHLDATFHQVQLRELKITEVKLQDLRLLWIWQHTNL